MEHPKTFSIYLAGPILGLSYEECVNWRKYVIQQLPAPISAYSPMRAKSNLKGHEVLQCPQDADMWTTSKGIFHRDMHDVRTCDGAIVNLMRAERVSIGTVAEIAILYELRKPMVLLMEKGNIHDHPFITEMCPFVVQDVQEAVRAIITLLLPVGH